MALDRTYLGVHSGIWAARVLNYDLLKLHDLEIIMVRKKKIMPKTFITDFEMVCVSRKTRKEGKILLQTRKERMPWQQRMLTDPGLYGQERIQ